MKRYIKSNRYQSILDNLVDGNKLWNPLTGEFDTLSDERLAELRNPTPVLLDGIALDNVHFFKNNKLWRRASAGVFPEDNRVYRNANNYKIYLNSFSGAALPYSVMYIADTATGDVYRREVTQGMGDFNRDMNELVSWLSAGNAIM